MKKLREIGGVVAIGGGVALCGWVLVATALGIFAQNWNMLWEITHIFIVAIGIAVFIVLVGGLAFMLICWGVDQLR